MPGNGLLEGPQDGEDESNVTPEEQAQYERFVGNGMNLIYDEKVMPGLIKRMSVGGDPVEALASVTSQVLLKVMQSAAKAGKPITDDALLLQGGLELLELLAELAQVAKIHSYTDQEKEAAGYRAADLVREQMAQNGQLDQAQQQKDAQEWVQADRTGQLDQMAPQLRELADKQKRKLRQDHDETATPAVG